MADAPTRAEPSGALDVRNRAIQHIAERAALEIAGTIAHTTKFEKLRQLGMPHAHVSQHGRQAWIVLDVAAVWPCRVTEIAVRVRDSVLAQARRQAAVDIRAVDVTVHVIDAGDVDQPGRRRVQ